MVRPGRTQRTKRDVLDGLIAALDLLQEASKFAPVGQLALATGAFTSILKGIKTTEENRQNIEDLTKSVQSITNIIDHAREHASGLYRLDEDLTKLADSMTTTIMKAEEMLSHPWPLRFIRNETDKTIITKLSDEISHSVAIFTASGSAKIQVELARVQKSLEAEKREAELERKKAEEERQKAETARRRTEERERESLIRSLPRAEAMFDLEVWRIMSACYAGTRQRTLKTIEAWLNDTNPNSPPVFWLYGPPGIGKTAIAKSVATHAQETGVLAANFFFSTRIGQGCSDGKMLFPTLAYQLASFDPSFKVTLAAALKHDPGLAQRSIHTQFRTLLQQPLISMSPRVVPLVIILDGLDECSDRDLIQKILHELFALAPRIHPSVKFFLTSRPESHISEVTQAHEGIHTYNLCQMERNSSSQDIEVYLRHYLNDIAKRRGWSVPWPSARDLDGLVTLCGGLFILASTMRKR
ncbi:hypothetical protein K474DRAFT_247508 [Panus rudis PR-1116 ss-1]|nr:hypothetical protein K474DRAFT_247508 [Panus rudis PR-1116 ss-1]